MTDDASSSTATRRFRRIKVEPRVLLAIAVVGLVLVLVRIVQDVVGREPGAFDRAILLALRQADATPLGVWLRAAFVDITALGSTTVITLVTIVAAAYLVVAGSTITAALLVVSISTAALVELGMKLFFARPRPDLVDHLVPVSSLSFPSGHAMLSAITYLCIGALLAAAQTRRRVRSFVLAVGVLLTLLIGISRVYLGVHWPTDVVAGWIAGSLWALLFWGVN